MTLQNHTCPCFKLTNTEVFGKPNWLRPTRPWTSLCLSIRTATRCVVRGQTATSCTVASWMRQRDEIPAVHLPWLLHWKLKTQEMCEETKTSGNSNILYFWPLTAWSRWVCFCFQVFVALIFSCKPWPFPKTPSSRYSESPLLLLHSSLRGSLLP